MPAPYRNSADGTALASAGTDADGYAIPSFLIVAAGTITDRSGTITSGGAAQTLAAANASRRYLRVQNLSVDVLWVNETGTATAASPSQPLAPASYAGGPDGGFLEYSIGFVPVGAISIIGPTTGQQFVAREG
jgi:hypothetical protein